MFLLSLKKMFKNKWITACLFLGCLLIVAIFSSIPVYTKGIMSKMLIRDLEDAQRITSVYPGTYVAKTILPFSSKQKDTAFKKYDEAINRMSGFIQNDALAGLDKLEDIQEITGGSFFCFDEKNTDRAATSALFGKAVLKSNKGLENKINYLAGRCFEKGKIDGKYEVIVSEQAAQKFKLSLGATYQMVLNNDKYKTNAPYLVKVVGVFEPKDVEDVFWYEGFKTYEEGLFMDYDTLLHDIIENDKVLLRNTSTGMIFDYTKLETKQVGKLAEVFNTQSQILRGSGASVTNPSLDKLNSFAYREAKLNKLIILLDIPLVIILIFYIYMVSNLIVGYDENEISVIKSRGGTRLQIMRIYFYECLIISAAAVAAAIPIGMLIASAVGYSNGFMEFVSRTSLPIDFSPEILSYALIGVLIFFAVTFLPIARASKKNILAHKQERVAAMKTPKWQKLCLDLILIAGAMYGLYLYNEAQSIVIKTGDSSLQSNNPLIFVMSSMFILGISLLILRIYPLAIRLIHWVGKRFWPASIHVSMVNLSRNKLMGKSIILFLTFTIGIGIFNATTARTINKNEEDKIKYANGADFVVKEEWEITGKLKEIKNERNTIIINAYTRPPLYSRYSDLDGIEATARVYRANNVTATGNGSKLSDGKLMGIVPDEFSKVAWSRDDLMPHHINEYLDVIAKNPNGCIISSGMAKSLNAKAGDEIKFKIEKFDVDYQIAVTVVGIVDFFPGYVPMVAPVVEQKGFFDFLKKEEVKNSAQKSGQTNDSMIIVNMDYLFKYNPVDPYEVWMKRTPDATTKQIYDGMAKNKIVATSIIDTKTEITTNIKNDSIIQGMNGTLSLAFVMSLVITCAGFLIYWIVDVKSRLLQFSILRSMGLSKKSLYVMLAFEELLTTSFAILGGTFIGGLASAIYVKSVGMYMDLTTQIPPFKTIIFMSDYFKIFSVVILLVAVCLIAIITIVSRLNIASTLKLGED